jgi:hypothetical protein
VEEVVRDDLAVDVVLGPPLFQDTQRFCEVLVERDRFVTQLSYKQVLLFDFLLEREGSFELFLRRFD